MAGQLQGSKFVRRPLSIAQAFRGLADESPTVAVASNHRLRIDDKCGCRQARDYQTTNDSHDELDTATTSSAQDDVNARKQEFDLRR
jgi:hypothetical protein